MKSQEALEMKEKENKPGTGENPVFVEAEQLLENMQKLTHSIAKRAYEFFETRGREFGHELEDWFQAESETLRRIPLEMSEDENRFLIRAETPGFKANEIKISAEPKRVIINGECEQTSEEKSEKTIFSERRSNRFCRSLEFPVEIDPNKVTASLKDGVLEIALPKAPVRGAVGVQVTTG